MAESATDGQAGVLVIGGGPAGAAAAYWLARQGHAVTIVEAGPMAGGMMGGGGDVFFRVNDLNGDGAVTKAEMEKALEQRFQAADTNHDGWLSKGELIMMRQRARGPGQ